MLHVHNLDLHELTLLASPLTIAYMTTTPMTFSLIGVENFRGYFTATLVGSIPKLAIGTVLVIIGLKTRAPLLSYLAYPLTAPLVASAIYLITF
jgi:ABC-type transport system involved in cytochrome c biogenesis permease component